MSCPTGSRRSHFSFHDRQHNLDRVLLNVIFVTIIAFRLYLFVLGRWTASGTSYSFVLIPLVTVVLATSLANETTTIQFLLGGTLTVLGVWVGALLPSKEKPS